MPDSQSNKKPWLIWLILIILVCLVFFGWLVFSKAKTSPQPPAPPAKIGSQKILVNCTATAETQPEKIPGWRTWLYPAVMITPVPYPEAKTELQPEYSVTKMLDHTEIGNIYYRIELDPRADLPRETRKVIEVCDENNQTVQFGTTSDTKVQGASENVKASTSLISASFISGKSTFYRVDGFIFTNGKWTLTDRIKSVKIQN